MSGWTTRKKGNVSLSHESTPSLVKLSIFGEERFADYKVIMNYGEFERLGDLVEEIRSDNPYKLSHYIDIKGRRIREGDIIITAKYGNRYFTPDEGCHCVEFCNGEFGSDIYSDFEPLSKYEGVEIIGHCEDYRNICEDGSMQGNMRSVLK